MTGPVPNDQDKPNDPQAYAHHLRLLKSMHCARPVLYHGLNHFISCITANRDGGRISLTVYLAGKRDGIDCNEIEIKPMNQETGTA